MRRLFLLAIPLSALALTATATGGRTVASASCPTVTSGVFTVGTDNPAYPPWFGGSPAKGSKWKISEPTSGKGFESAVAYAVAKQLGYPRAKVVWNYTPFARSYAPGKKAFDVDINEISYTPARAKVVDFSSSYYDVAQAVVANKGTKAAAVRSLAGLRGLKLGVQIGTTSLDAVNQVVKPSAQPKVFNDSNDVVTALKQKQVDAVVVDLPTAFFLTAAQVPTAKIVGQFSAPGGDTWGALLQKGSPLTACVNQAIGDLKESGALASLEQRWLGAAAGAPVLK